MICDYPEKFFHDINKEFDADNQFAAALRGLKRAQTQKLNAENEVELANKPEGDNTVTPLVAKDIEPEGPAAVAEEPADGP